MSWRRTDILNIHIMLRELQLRRRGHVVQMNDERLTKLVFHGHITMGARRQGEHRRHHKGIPEVPTNQPRDLEGPRPRLTNPEKSSKDCSSNISSQPARCCCGQKRNLQVTGFSDPEYQYPIPSSRSVLPTNIRVLISSVGHLRTQCNDNPITPLAAPIVTAAPTPRASTPTVTPITRDHTSDVTPLSITTTSSPPSFSGENTFEIPSTTNLTTAIPTASSVKLIPSCPHCYHTLASRIGLVGTLRIHCTVVGEPVSGPSAHTRRICLHFPHYSRTSAHRVDLFGCIRIQQLARRYQRCPLCALLSRLSAVAATCD
ncbi:hypothetical protein SprV_0602172900 [Sparganum proliferum]